MEEDNRDVEDLERDLFVGWNKVNYGEERFPKDGECYLVTDGRNIWMAYWYEGKRQWLFAECTNARQPIDWTEIIGWMELPPL